MRKLNSGSTVVDNQSPLLYPDGRIKDNTGSGNGTQVNERVYGDIHQAIAKMMRLYGIAANNLPDNETNGFQIIEGIISLASKNDFVLPLSLNTGVLSVPIKLGFMLNGEQLVCKANFDLTAETQIKGSDNITFAFSANGSFKTNEYVRLIKTSGGVDIIRLVDNISLDAMVSDLNYLKKASQTEENAGATDTKATTPLVNLVAFTKRVIGIDSTNFLATLLRNGLYNSAHFTLVEELKKVKNKGFVFGLDIENGSVGDTFAVSGDIASCTIAELADNTTRYRIILNNAQSTTNYYVRAFIQSQGADMFSENSFGSLVFKPVNATTFDFSLREFISDTQSLKIHFEVVNI